MRSHRIGKPWYNISTANKTEQGENLTGIAPVAFSCANKMEVNNVDDYFRRDLGKFREKSYGCIFTDSQENVQKIRSLIAEINDFEAGYMPDDIVRVFSPRFNGDKTSVSIGLAYTGKFYEIDLNQLMLVCWAKGVPMWYMQGNYSDTDCVYTQV